MDCFCTARKQITHHIHNPQLALLCCVDSLHISLGEEEPEILLRELRNGC